MVFKIIFSASKYVFCWCDLTVRFSAADLWHLWSLLEWTVIKRVLVQPHVLACRFAQGLELSESLLLSNNAFVFILKKCFCWRITTVCLRYKPLASFSIVDDPALGRCLEGSITMAIAVGVKGGALRTNPFYSQSLQILGNPSSSQLAAIMCCVGLANTFAANRAIATEVRLITHWIISTNVHEFINVFSIFNPEF